MTRARRLTVTIDRLVLDGVSPADAGALRRALETELRARLAEAKALADVALVTREAEAGVVRVVADTLGVPRRRRQ